MLSDMLMCPTCMRVYWHIESTSMLPVCTHALVAVVGILYGFDCYIFVRCALRANVATQVCSSPPCVGRV